MKIRPLITLSISLAIIYLAGPSVMAAETTYTWNKPADHPVFNKITDNPKVGDERKFLSVRDINNPNGARSLKVQPGQELALTVYFDNNASKAGLSAANSRVRLVFPGNLSKSFSVIATVSANNADPASTSDAVTITSDQPIRLDYETGSAKLWNNVWRGQALTDSIIDDGTAIGYDQLDGNIPGGPAYSGYVTVKIKVTASTPTSVPNTGPGDVIGIVAGASAAGTAFHMMRTTRRRR